MPTRFASSTLVIRPSAWISFRILRSISSRLFDTGSPNLGLADFAGNNGNTHIALPRHAQFYFACSAELLNFRGKFADADCKSCIARKMPYIGNGTFDAEAMPLRAPLRHSAD